MELKLDRKLADKRIFPAIDVDASGTRKEEILLAPDELQDRLEAAPGAARARPAAGDRAAARQAARDQEQRRVPDAGPEDHADAAAGRSATTTRATARAVAGDGRRRRSRLGTRPRLAHWSAGSGSRPPSRGAGDPAADELRRTVSEARHPPRRTSRRTVTCTCGNTFTTRSTAKNGVIHADVCSHCHPFYTGKQKILDTGGRVARFEKRFGKTGRAGSQVAAPTASVRRPSRGAGPAPSSVPGDRARSTERRERRRPCSRHAADAARRARRPRAASSPTRRCTPTRRAARRARPALRRAGPGRRDLPRAGSSSAATSRPPASSPPRTRRSPPRPPRWRPGASELRGPAARCCWCRATRTTTRTSSSRSRRGRAARSRRCSPATCCGCTCATPSGSGWKTEVLDAEPSPTSAATRTSRSRSRRGARRRRATASGRG